MYFFIGFFVGILFYFFWMRYGDKVSKDAAAVADFDCEKCTAHCNGYWCHCARINQQKEQEDQAAIS